ncbi:MAG: protein TolQ, partial [Devosiaceae bacterium]|nr:protein TolQ [Devosiaceae bacterium]
MENVEVIEHAAEIDFSLFALFLQADWVVKSVIIGLLIASVWCWGIIIDKVILYRKTNKELKFFDKNFWSGQS